MDDASRPVRRLRRMPPSAKPPPFLCSIALLSRAQECVARDSSLDPAIRAGVSAALAAAVGAEGLCGGQFDDLFPSGMLTEHVLVDRYRRKTGVLFAAAFRCAGLIAGRTPHNAGPSACGGRQLGVAFQRYDDLIDLLGSAETAGKDIGQDRAKVTLASLPAPRAARRRAEAELAAVQEDLRAVCGEAMRWPWSHPCPPARRAFCAEARPAAAPTRTCRAAFAGCEGRGAQLWFRPTRSPRARRAFRP